METADPRRINDIPTSNSLAPIILFVFNRISHTRQTIEALQKNDGSGESHIYIFSDGPRTADEAESVRSVRDYVKQISGFAKVTVIERKTNLGLAQSIISGVTEIVNRYDKVIILEDDMLTSQFFLKFMNDALEVYKDEAKVISIHGYIYPVKGILPPTFFMRGADCWGWATWKRGWELFEPDGKKLLNELHEKNLEHDFDLGGAYQFTDMLKDQIAGRNNSWAIRWHAAAFLRNKLTLYPGKSLVYNIGLDAGGTHCNSSDVYDTKISLEPIKIDKQYPEEDQEAVRRVADFFRSSRPSWMRRTLIRIASFLMRIRQEVQ